MSSVQVTQIMRWIDDLAQRSGLCYSLACGSLAYAHGLSTTPAQHGVVMISSAEHTNWQSLLRKALADTMFIVNSDESHIRVFLERDSETHVLMLVRNERAEVDWIEYPGSKIKLASVLLRSGDMKTVLHICNKNSAYHSRESESGGLQSAVYGRQSRLCLVDKGESVVVETCTFSGGAQHVELLSNERLRVRSLCLVVEESQSRMLNISRFIRLNVTEVVLVTCASGAPTPREAWVLMWDQRYLRNIGLCVGLAWF